MIREAFPLAEFLGSAANMNGLQQAVSPGKGKIRTVQLLYDQRILESAVNTNSTDFCTATTKRGNCSQNYEIDTTDNILVEQLIEREDLVEVCLDNGQFLAKQLAKMVDALERKIATRWTNDTYALAGAWGSDVPSGDLNGSVLEVDTVTGGTIQPFAMEIINDDLTKSGYCAPVFIAAGSSLNRYYRRMLAGCCSNQGIDLGSIFAQYGSAVAYDRRVKNAFGDEVHGLAVQLGAVAPLWFTWNQWKDGMAVPQGGSDYVNYGLITPRLGVPVDVYFLDKCPGSLHIIVAAVTKCVGLPTDLFPTGDLYDGVTFVNKIKCIES